MDRQELLEALFGADRDDCCSDWAAVEALAPGTVARLPGDMQEKLLQHCLYEFQEGLYEDPDQGNPRPCKMHALWAQLLVTAPPSWTERGFLEVGFRKLHEDLRWLKPTAGAAQLHWRLLADMGGCCEGEREKALRSLEVRKAPLEELLIHLDPVDEDELEAGEHSLAGRLLEGASTEAARRARAVWQFRTTVAAGEGAAWWACILLAEEVLRWRGPRAAWVSAVMRAADRRARQTMRGVGI